jgi:hypothetical protein
MRDLIPCNHHRRSLSDRHNHRSFCRCRSQVSIIKGKGRGRAAKGGIRRTMCCAELQNRLLPSVLLYRFPYQSSPHTRRSGAESERKATSRAHVLGVSIAHLPGVGAGDELEDCGFDALVWFVNLLDCFPVGVSGGCFATYAFDVVVVLLESGMRHRYDVLRHVGEATGVQVHDL